MLFLCSSVTQKLVPLKRSRASISLEICQRDRGSKLKWSIEEGRGSQEQVTGFSKALCFTIGYFRSNRGCSLPAEVRKVNPLLTHFIPPAIESCFKCS